MYARHTEEKEIEQIRGEFETMAVSSKR